MLGNAAIAADQCQPISYIMEKNDMQLSGNPKTATQIFFFTNQSDKSIFIDRVSNNPGASAGWSTYLRPGNWSVLLLNKKNFTVHCSMIEPGKVIPLNCEEMIQVCTPPNLTINSKLKGNYWLVEDKTFDVAMKILEKKGIKEQA
jgi:hypothetical protein